MKRGWSRLGINYSGTPVLPEPNKNKLFIYCEIQISGTILETELKTCYCQVLLQRANAY